MNWDFMSRPMDFDLSSSGGLMGAFLPDLVMIAGAMIMLLVAAWKPESPEHDRRVARGCVFVTLLTAVAVLYYLVRGAVATSGPGPIAVDQFRWGVDLIFLLATLLAIALAEDYNRREGAWVSEAHVLTLFATSGMMLLGAARDLVLVFLGIEVMSVAVYVLAGLNRRSPRAAEAALKYFLLGAFSTGFLLYGIALIYGATGTTNIVTIGTRVALAGEAQSPLLLVGIGLLVVGLSFKVAAAPFHMWTPDVYEGAPTPYTAYMAAAVKAAAFAVFLRIWIEAFSGTPRLAWHTALWWLAVATMVVGNLVALGQTNIKRMLAYSSIAHAGYILVGVVAASALGASAFIFYLIAYTLATMGAFGVVIALDTAGERRQAIEDYAGLWHVRPGHAVAMAVFMLALLGFPFFGGMGFFAKWYMLQAALKAQLPLPNLAVWVVMTSVVSAGYYLRVIMVMFMRPRTAEAAPLAPVAPMTNWVIGATAALIVLFGIWPSPVVRFANRTVPAPPAAEPTQMRPIQVGADGAPITVAPPR